MIGSIWKTDVKHSSRYGTTVNGTERLTHNSRTTHFDTTYLKAYASVGEARASISPGALTLPGATVRGNHTFASTVTLMAADTFSDNTGSISSGHSPGILAVSAPVTLTSTATFQADIDGTTAKIDWR